jgi:hypothetical protein
MATGDLRSEKVRGRETGAQHAGEILRFAQNDTAEGWEGEAPAGPIRCATNHSSPGGSPSLHLKSSLTQQNTSGSVEL